MSKSFDGVNTYTLEEAIKKSTEYFKGDATSATVFIGKYALKNNEDQFIESTPDDMHRRLAREFALAESKYADGMDEEEIYNLFKGFEYVVPQGSPMSAIGNPYAIQSASNCFVIGSPMDSYGGIFQADQQLAQLAKRRAGVGFDISEIRPKGLPTSNAAKTTDGIAIFMDRFSNTCREVAQGGRRGALLLSISVHHPEIETFINIKRNQTRVTGANISIKLSDSFMKAVKNDENYTQQWPIDSKNPKISREVKARSIWNQIVHAAWESAEPGLLFWDNVRKNTPADIYQDAGFGSTSTNPCLVGDTEVLFRQLLENSLTEYEYSSVKICEIDQFMMKHVEFFDGVRWIKNNKFRKTGTNKKIMKIVLESGDTIRATEYHRFVMENDDNKLTVQLVPGDILKSVVMENDTLYSRPVVSKVVDDGYEDVYCTTVDTTHNFAIKTANHAIIVGNCGEINLSPNDSCRLIAINLYSFVDNKFTETATFNYEKFAKIAYKSQHLMDSIVDIELGQVDQIINKIESDPEPESIKKTELDLWKNIRNAARKGRRTGLGITGLGDALAALNVRYGSRESIEITEAIYRTMAVNAYKATIDMAEIRGKFEVFDYELEKDHPFVSRVVNAIGAEYVEKWKKFGRRNIALTTTAPAGSVSMMTRTTSGIEPAFRVSYTRRRKITANDPESSVTYVDAVGDKFTESKIFHHAFKDWMNVTGKTEEQYNESPYFNATANDVDWRASVDIQAAAQKWVCHSISKTCNLPSNVTEDLVSQVYMDAWEKGCKGFTVYRDGCRSGILIDNPTESAKKVETPKFVEINAVKRPQTLECEVHHVRIKTQQWVVFVGLYDGKPYEVFGGIAENIQIPKKIRSGHITKIGKKEGRGVYSFSHGEGEDKIVVKDIVKAFADESYAFHTLAVSGLLRTGMGIKYVLDILNKADEEADLYSFNKVVSRVLKHHIKDGTKSGEKCPQCGSDMIFTEGCKSCSCGYSKC